eukprot:scaffold470_cov257-Pinguiococcus_pyrenoidosus.AAC.40
MSPKISRLRKHPGFKFRVPSLLVHNDSPRSAPPIRAQIGRSVPHPPNERNQGRADFKTGRCVNGLIDGFHRSAKRWPADLQDPLSARPQIEAPSLRVAPPQPLGDFSKRTWACARLVGGLSGDRSGRDLNFGRKISPISGARRLTQVSRTPESSTAACAAGKCTRRVAGSALWPFDGRRGHNLVARTGQSRW